MRKYLWLVHPCLPAYFLHWMANIASVQAPAALCPENTSAFYVCVSGILFKLFNQLPWKNDYPLFSFHIYSSKNWCGGGVFFMAWGRMPRLYFHREIVTAFETIKSNVHLGNGVSAADNFQSRILFAENRFRPFHVFHDWYAKGTSCPAWAAPDTFSPIMSQQFIMFSNSLRHLSPRGGQGGKHNKSCCLSAYLPAHTVKT